MDSSAQRTIDTQPRRDLIRVVDTRPVIRKSGRIEAIDLARGIAIALMIISHGIKGLLTFDQIPSWGLVPIHLVTKFSSSLFIMVFGVALAIVHLPHVGSPAWPGKRKKLLLRGLEVFFWYKLLTIVEMTPLYEPREIISALLYQSFPVYVEVLGFYAIALLWVPFVLPLWKKMGATLKLAAVAGTALLSGWLHANFDFWGVEPLQAVLVEHENHYTWGQLSRAPLVFAGLAVGEGMRRAYRHPGGPKLFAGILGLVSAVFLVGFLWSAAPELYESLVSVARNEGKHPPELQFMLFSVGGAFLILAGSVVGGGRLASIARPVTLIGKYPLQSFVFHIFVIFVFYRYLLGYFHQTTYPHAVFLTVLLLMLTAGWVTILRWIREQRS